MSLLLNVQNITFAYEAAADPLFEDLSFTVAAGWTGVVGANGSGKTTLLKLATGLLAPLNGTINPELHDHYCPQRTDDSPPRLNELMRSTEKSAILFKNQLHVQPDWLERWHTLSFGERKRAQIAVALWLEPDVLALDEPANHLDIEARDLILGALLSYRGIGLLVSHDRDFLDSLCSQCLFIDDTGVTQRPGNYSDGALYAENERETLKRAHLKKKQQYQKLYREANRRKQEAQKSDRRRSKRGIAKKDHSAKEKIDRARFSGKDGVAGRVQNQMLGRLSQARQEWQNTKISKEYELGIWLPAELSRKKCIFSRTAGFIQLGESKRLAVPNLSIGPTDRIALSGVNGSGKSTLVREIFASLNLNSEHLTYVPQEVDLSQTRQLLREAQKLPNEQLGHLMTIISRLGSRPDQLLQSIEPSPGETRKLLLALGMTRAPHIIIMDEPTNHMDLPSIECLEAALLDCPCALLLVSHDQRFLNALTSIHWCIEKSTNIARQFELRIR